MIKVAYICEPQVGGTYTTFKLLREPLREHGVEFICICPFDGALYTGSVFEHDEGVVFIQLSGDASEDADCIMRHLSTNQFDAVVVLTGSYDLTPVLISRYGSSLKVIGHIDHITRGTYRPTIWLREYCDGILGVSERHAIDFERYYGITGEELKIIWHGVAEKPASWLDDKSDTGPLEIGWLGRVEDLQKNVMILPRIADELNRQGYRNKYVMHIVGSGPDSCRMMKLHQQLGLGSEVVLHGTLPDEKLQDYLRKWHVFLFPSRFEGFGFALAEAMASGCVPIVSQIKGVFDHLVTEDCGYIVKSGRVKDYASVLANLIGDRKQIGDMARASRRRMIEEFSIDRMAREHADYFRRIVDQPRKRKPNKVLYRQNTLGDRVRSLVPAGAKKTARNICEKFGISL
jgi:glycosyltransferase involved in cell wall biosynthesis